MTPRPIPAHSLRRRIAAVEIYDTRAADNVFDPAGGRWVTYCTDQGYLVNHQTLALAIAFAAVPGEFCPLCPFATSLPATGIGATR